MITKQDLETLQRLYTPLSKILLEHLREDHGYGIVPLESIRVANRQQANRIRDLMDALDETTKEFNALKSDYEALREINNVHCDLIQRIS